MTEGESTDCPGEALVLGDVCDVERLHCVFDVLGVHVVDLTDITVPEEKHIKHKQLLSPTMNNLVKTPWSPGLISSTPVGHMLAPHVPKKKSSS